MAMNDGLERLHYELSDFDEARYQCFLCGGKLSIKGQTSEHVIPQWIQRRHSLWDQRLVLLNGTDLPYRQLTVPCCDDCNKYRLKPLEDSMCQTVEGSRDAVLALGPKLLFLWLGKIFYGILYRELMLLTDRGDPNAGAIITEDFLSRYRMHRFFLQQARGLVELKDFQPGSIFVFNAQPLPNPGMEWDFVDNVDSLFISVRVGKVALFGILADGGAQQLEEEIYVPYYPIALHPLQIRELCARFSYRSLCATRTPKYITGGGSPHQTWQMPLGGLSMKPLFEDFNPEMYAQILSFYTGQPYEHIFRDGRVITWLRDDAGVVRTMPYRDYPYVPSISSH